MAEYIERKQAIAVACKGCNKEFPNEPCEPSECYIQQGLFNIAAADVVEVVRCKDCKHLMHSAIYKQHFCTNIYGLRNICISNNDFCSYGERREGE